MREKIGCLLFVAIVIALMSVQCVWNSSYSWNVREYHRVSGNSEIMVARSAEIYNPVSWVFSWPHAIWFLKETKYTLDGKRAYCRIWLMPNDNVEDREPDVVVRFHKESAKIEFKYENGSEEKWAEIEKSNRHLYDPLYALLAK